MIETKLLLSWDDVFRQSNKLADLIINSGQKFDYMVVVPRGGYFPANVVARRIGIGPLGLLHACVGSYDEGINNRQSGLSVGQMPSPDVVRGKKVLVIDEVCDSGETLSYVISYLQKAGADKVSCGVLHYKTTNNQTNVAPDWAVEKTDQWIVYPWEED